jgi:cytochrome P450
VNAEITLDELELDPYPHLAKLRSTAPAAFVPALDMWFVTRWDDVRCVITSPDLFTAATEPSWLRDVLGPNMLAVEGPEQARVKDACQPPFTPSVARGWVTDRLPQLCDELIEAFPIGPVDLMTAYAEPIAVIALRDALGWDEAWEQIAQWTRGVCTGLANFENDPAKAAIAQSAHTESEASIRKQLSGGNLTAGLAHLASTGMSTLEIVSNVRLCMSGGINEPRDGIALTTWALLTHPDELQRCKADSAAWRDACEESFRWISPVGTATRQTTTAVDVDGVTIPKGSMVSAVLSSANRDERRWTDPERFNPRRNEGVHIAFSEGPHVCLGAWLGRSTVRVAVQHLFNRLPNLTLPEPGSVEIRGFEFRGPVALNVQST